MNKEIKLFQGFYFAYYCVLSVYSTFIPLFFRFIGLSQSQIGYITSIGSIISIISLFLFGKLADKTNKNNMLLAFLSVASVMTLMSYKLYTDYPVILTLNIFYMFFSVPIMQLSDALAFNYTNKNNIDYNMIKIFGSFGYALIALGGGFFINININNMFFIALIAYIASAVIAYKMPNHRNVNKNKNKVSYIIVLKNKKITLLLLINLIVYIPVSFYNSFFTIYLNEVAKASVSLVGVSIFLSIVSEMPFLLLANKLIKKIGYKKTIVISCVLMSIRWGLISVLNSDILIILVNCLKGFSDIVIFYCTAKIISIELEEGLQASGQALLGIVTYGIARIAGNYIGGVLYDTFSGRHVFAACAILAAVTAVIYFSWGDKNSKKMMA